MGGAVVLMTAAIVVKVIGALFKIPLTRILGGGGMGYFMTAYGFFNPIYALSVAGFPVAVSRLTAQNVALGHQEDARCVLIAALLAFPLIGLGLAALIFCGAGGFAHAVGNPAAKRAVLAIAPAIFFACVSAVFRGSFEGSRNMLPTAASQVTEAVVKLAAGIFLALRCVNSGYAQYELDKIVFGIPVATLEQAQRVIAPQAAAAAICGVSISTAAGCLLMILCHLTRHDESTRRQEPQNRPTRYMGVLLRYAFPVCLGALVVNLTSLIDLASVMNRLSVAAGRDLAALAASHAGAGLEGMPPSEIPNFLYGSYTGLAMTVFNFVPAVTTSLGVSALPMISGLYARKQRPRLRIAVESVLRITAMVAVPAGMGLCILAEPILRLLFGSNAAEIAIAAPLLQMLGAAAIPVAVTAPISSMLQAVGRVYTPVWLMLLGGAAKLTVNWLLVAIPSINMRGAPIGTFCCYLILMLGGAAALSKAVGVNLNLIRIFAKPAGSGILCCITARGAYAFLLRRMGHPAVILPAIVLGGLCYLICLILFGAFDENDLAMLPQGAKFTKLLAKNTYMR